MVVLKRQDFIASDTDVVDIDVAGIGAGGVYVMGQSEHSGGLIFDARNAAGTKSTRLVHLLTPQGGTQEDSLFWMPLMCDVLRITAQGNLHKQRLVFVDEVIAPGGVVLLNAVSSTLGPTANTAGSAMSDVGNLVRRGQLVGFGTKAFHLGMTCTINGVTCFYASAVSVATATGGGAASAIVPVQGNIGYDVTNDDAVATQTIQWQLYGYLGSA